MNSRPFVPPAVLICLLSGVLVFFPAWGAAQSEHILDFQSDVTLEDDAEVTETITVFAATIPAPPTPASLGQVSLLRLEVR